MRVEEYLRKKGVVYKVVHRPSGTFFITRCPMCGEEDFAINVDTGSFNCFHLRKCGIKGSFTKLKQLYGDSLVMQPLRQTYSELKIHIQPPDKEVGEFLKSRGFNEQIYRQFKSILGRSGDAICFLYKDKGKLYSVKYRDMKEKRFWREKNTPPLLYNMEACEGKEDLFIVEGELDVIAAKHYGIDAVSVPSGAQDESWIEYNWDYLQKFKRVILMFDNDEAGQKNIKRIAKRIGLDKCINVLLPMKDLNECLLAGVSEQEIYYAIATAKEVAAEYVKSCYEYVERINRLIRDKGLTDGIETPFPRLTNILKGWRKGELTIWTGINGSGKSNILLQVTLDLCRKEQKVLIGSFEMQPERYLKWIAQMLNGETDEITVYEDTLYALGKYLYCIDKVGSIKEDDLFSAIEYAARRHDVKHVIIDSLMRVVYKTSDVYKEQADFVVELCRLAQEYDIHIHLVAHPRKGDKDTDTPDKVDVAGSYDITNNAHNVIVVHRIDGDEKTLKKLKLAFCNTILIVKKNREYGTLGICPLIFNEKYKIFTEAE